MNAIDLNLVAAVIFGLAVTHTFAAKVFEHLAHRHSRHAGLLHLLGEVEVAFGFWAAILVVVIAVAQGAQSAIEYAESRRYTEPLFVFVVMIVAASQPVLHAVRALCIALARRIPVRTAVAETWMYLALVPLAGSLITEPAAMTLAALMLSPLAFRPDVPERLKYAALGVLFVNVSIGGTLTSFAAPPVLMVAQTWNWDSAFMAATFGWKAAIAVVVNATLVTLLLKDHVRPVATSHSRQPTPAGVMLVHLAFLAAVVLLAHHPVMFLGVLLLFLGYTQAYPRHQGPLIFREALLVAFFLAGLVVLGGMQRWWLQPVVASLEPTALFFGSLALTAVTDNAALTYLGSRVDGMTAAAQYMLMAGAVAGGGLTVIANAPNPAGVTLLKRGFRDGAIGAGGLLLGALAPTVVAAAMLLI